MDIDVINALSEIELRNINALDLETVEECNAVIARLYASEAAIEAQLGAATAEYRHTGKSGDPRWWHAAKAAKQFSRVKRVAVLERRAFLVQQRKAAATAVHAKQQEGESRLFVLAAREMLPRETYLGIIRQSVDWAPQCRECLSGPVEDFQALPSSGGAENFDCLPKLRYRSRNRLMAADFGVGAFSHDYRGELRWGQWLIRGRRTVSLQR
jgi:hypothetical protein